MKRRHKVYSNTHPYKNYHYKDKFGLKQGQFLFHYSTTIQVDISRVKNNSVNGIYVIIDKRE